MYKQQLIIKRYVYSVKNKKKKRCNKKYFDFFVKEDYNIVAFNE